ncbi:MAG: OprD family outer membrane porin [Candidatus Methylomirabilales bacterium]
MKKLLLLVGLLAVMLAPQSSRAEEAGIDDEPAPEAVEGLHGPMARALRERVREETLFPQLKRKLEKQPPFLRDTELTLKPRTYYFDQRLEDNSRRRAWALGGSLNYRSGWLKEYFAIGAELFTSQKLIGEPDEDGTRLLKPGQESYTVLGQLYAALRYEDHTLTLYRQELELPYVNKQDSRMTPNTFEGYTLRGTFALPEADKMDYIIGFLAKMKPRDADSFISMSEAAGVPRRDRGLAMVGARVGPWGGLLFGATNDYVPDVINIGYAEADYTLNLSEDLGLRLKGQFTDQRSVGDDLLTGSAFDTWVLGGRAAASYRGAILSLAFSTTDEEEAIRSPHGRYPGYVNLMQADFNRAGEDAWLLGLSYHFKRVGLDNLSAFANYAEGYNARDSTTDSSLPDQREFDITGDYRVRKGPLRGFWLRVRWSVLDIDGEDNNRYNVRVILNYAIPVL